MKIIANHIVEAITLVTAVWNYNHIKGTRYVYFIPVMAFILIGELGAVYFIQPSNRNEMKNLHIYLVVAAIETIFLGYQFYFMLKSEKMKRFTLIGTSLLTFLMTIWFCFFVDIGNLLTSTLGIIGFFLSSVSCYYLYESFVHTEESDTNLIRSPDFWFALGVLIYWVGSTLAFVLYFFLKENQFLIFGMPLYRLFPQVFSVVLYGNFTIAIILWKKYQG